MPDWPLEVWRDLTLFYGGMWLLFFIIWGLHIYRGRGR